MSPVEHPAFRFGVEDGFCITHPRGSGREECLGGASEEAPVWAWRVMNPIEVDAFEGSEERSAAERDNLRERERGRASDAGISGDRLLNEGIASVEEMSAGELKCVHDVSKRG